MAGLGAWLRSHCCLWSGLALRFWHLVPVIGGLAACGPLSLDLGSDESTSAGTGGSSAGSVSTGATSNSQAGSGGAGIENAGGRGGVVADPAPIVGFPDSCPLDVAVGVDCSEYPAEATCKLGMEIYHCERGRWMSPEGIFVVDPTDVACPTDIASGASCQRYSAGARCCSPAGWCFECLASGQVWRETNQ